METKTRILQQATTLFWRYGIKSVSMDDLAASLAISKKTLYKAFANKDELVQQVVADYLERLVQECGEAAKLAHHAVELLVLLSSRGSHPYPPAHLRLLHDLKKYHPANWETFQHFKNTFLLDLLADTLRRGVAEQLFWPDLDVDVLARLHLNGLDMLFDSNLYPPAEFIAPRLCQVLNDHFLRGITTPRGQRVYAACQPPPACPAQGRAG